MRISDWSSDVCSSDLPAAGRRQPAGAARFRRHLGGCADQLGAHWFDVANDLRAGLLRGGNDACRCVASGPGSLRRDLSSLAAAVRRRSEEHTSELQSLMRISYAVFCLKKTQYKHQCTHVVQNTISIYYKQ